MLQIADSPQQTASECSKVKSKTLPRLRLETTGRHLKSYNIIQPIVSSHSLPEQKNK